jgi:transcriptional regulator with XRE-family HTH domain
MNIADRIDLAMKLAGYQSQAEFARASGVSTSTLARILSNESQPTPTNLAAIAKGCKQTIDWLVTGESPADAKSATIELTYCVTDELALLTQYRLATDMGKQFIQIAAKNAEKKPNISIPTNQP